MEKTFIIDLVSMKPFRESNSSVILLLQKMMDLLQGEKKVMDCQSVWSLPSPIPADRIIKYNHDAMDFLDSIVSSGQAGIYGIYDWDIIRKGRKGKAVYVNARVGCYNTGIGNHNFGYGISLVFETAVAQKLMERGLKEIVAEMARAISAEIGRIDYTDYDRGGGIISSESMDIAAKWLYPDDIHLESQIPGASWWTLLSAQHLSKLGGKAAIMENAPCFAVHDLSSGNYEAIALQLTADPFTAKEEDFAPLRQYLRPILPPVEVHSLAFELKSGRIPMSRIEQLVTSEELAQAQELCSLSFQELRNRSLEAGKQ